MPNNRKMTDFEMDTANAIHKLVMQVGRLIRKNNDLTGKLDRMNKRHDNLVEYVSERNKDLNRLTECVRDSESEEENGVIEVITIRLKNTEDIVVQLIERVRELEGERENKAETLNPVVGIDREAALQKVLVDLLLKMEEKMGEELNLVKNRLKSVEVQNGVNSDRSIIEDRFQATELTMKTLSREIDNLGLDVSGIRDILTAHTKRMDVMDVDVADRINQFHDDIEGFRNYLADMPVYNEPLVLNFFENHLRRIERLELSTHTHHDEEQPYDPEVPYKTRLARSLANGNEDMQSDLENILRILPEDNVRVLLGYIKSSVDTHRSSAKFSV